MSNDPSISVVTVCYNMADYIEQTIRSVVSHGYPNLEYIVVDGASTDAGRPGEGSARRTIPALVAQAIVQVEAINVGDDTFHLGFSLKKGTTHPCGWASARRCYLRGGYEHSISYA